MTIQENEVPFRRVGIVGLGLMGGSLARAIKVVNPDVIIQASSSNDADLSAAVDTGAIDRAVETPSETVQGVDLVVYAAPLSVTLRLIEEQVGLCAPEAVVMDVSSLKTPIMELVGRLGVGEQFVGAHPMAGGEGTGFGYARADLYRGARIWLTESGVTPRARDRVLDLWSGLGASPAWIDPVTHDQQMVLVSHLPQLVSNVLASVLANSGIERAELGPGGRDMTRLAGSGAGLWRDLLEFSAGELAPAMRKTGEEIERVAGFLEQLAPHDLDEVMDLMARTRRWKEGEGWNS